MNLIRSAGKLSSKLLFLSESDVRRCLPVATALEANRKALGSLRLKEDGGAVVPTRIGLPYYGEKGRRDSGGESSSAAADWTLFKPAAYYPPFSGGGDDNDDGDDDVLMGMKLVSIRAGNAEIGRPTVPATVVLVDARTGEVNAVIGATYLTAARTASGSAIATELCASRSSDPIHLVVFGAGLQAELHIEAIRCVKDVGRITIVNRSAERAERLRMKLMEGKDNVDCDDDDIDVVLLEDVDNVKRAVGDADVICTTTNTATPLFRGEWVKPGCHLNGIGSYTPSMEEIDSGFVSSRCRVVVDTKEALDVGDLQQVLLSSDNFVGLLGDMIHGEVGMDLSADGSKLDCSLFKSVGTAIQDVITAHAAWQAAQVEGVGTSVEM